jgi:hypothetical protein
MHTLHLGIETTWKLPVMDGHYFHVFIWQDAEYMRAAFAKAYPDRKLQDALGACLTYDHVWDSETQIVSAGRKFGELHLVHELIGSGYIAHELMHAVNYFVTFKEWDWTNKDEDIASLAESMHRDFWTVFYERYEKTTL